jgi:hypothetical protein
MRVRCLLEHWWRRLVLGLEADGGARAFVRATWVIMFAATLAFVDRYGSSLPHRDEFHHTVPLLTGQLDLSLTTLWQQHNEYRWPLPKLLFYLLLKATGSDFRSGMYACVIALGGLSGAMILAARRLRGRTSYADALFPLLFLHWGHYENLLMGCQICYILPLCFACTILLIMLRHRDGLTLRSSLLAGGCLVGLPLCGGSGVGLTPALAIWLVGTGIWSWFAPGPRQKKVAPVSIACAAAALLLVGLYFVGYQRPPYHPPSPSLRATLHHSLRCLAVGFGPGVERLWPFSGLVVPALLLAFAGLLLARSIRDPRERRRAAGLVCLLGAVGCVVLGVGWARAGLGPQQAFEGRYSVFAIPMICAIFLYSQICSNRGINELIQMSIFIFACFIFPMNMLSGKDRGRATHAVMRHFEHDMVHGVSPLELARRHGKFIFMSDNEQELSRLLLDLRRAGIGKFRLMQSESPGLEVPTPVIPHEAQAAIGDEGTVRRR